MKQAFISTLTISLLFIFACSSCSSDPKESSDIPKIDFKRTSNEVIAVNIRDAKKLHPVLSSTAYANVALDHIFQFLEYINPETAKLEPQLAKTAPIIEDILDKNGEVEGSRFTYEIHENATWPNGTAVTVADYVFSLKSIFVPQVDAAPLRPYLGSIKSIELYPDNPRKITVSTKRKYIISQDVIGALIAMMPKYYYDPNGLLDDIDINDLLDEKKAQDLADNDPRLQEFADYFQSPKMTQNPIGSGPYELEEWETEQRIVLKKKANWWAEQLNSTHPFYQAKVDKITYRVITDENVVATELKDEQIDVRSDMAPADFNELKENEFVRERYNFHKVPTSAFFFLYLNNQDPRLRDKGVRRALAHSIDVQKIIETLYDNSPIPVNGPVHPSKAYYRKDLTTLPLDIERAKILLAEAGWKDSNDNGIVDKEVDGELLEMELEFLINSGRESHSKMALIFEQDAIKAGIKIIPVGKTAQVLTQDITARKYQITPAGARNSNIAWDPKPRFHSESDSPNGFNKMGFRNEKADRLIDEIQTTLDVEKRNELYREFQALIYDEQPMVFLFAPSNNMIIHKRFDAKTYSVRPGYFPALFELNL